MAGFEPVHPLRASQALTSPAAPASQPPTGAAAVPAAARPRIPGGSPEEAPAVQPATGAAATPASPPPVPPAPAGAGPRPPERTFAAASAKERWRDIVEAVRRASPRHGKSLAYGRLIKFEDEEITIAFTSEADFHRSTVSGMGRALIEQTLSERLGRPTRLNIDLHAAKDAAPSIAEEETKERTAHERSVDHRVRRDPTLLSALRIFGGEVEHIQILERDRPAVVDPEAPDDAT